MADHCEVFVLSPSLSLPLSSFSSSLCPLRPCSSRWKAEASVYGLHVLFTITTTPFPPSPTPSPSPLVTPNSKRQVHSCPRTSPHVLLNDTETPSPPPSSPSLPLLFPPSPSPPATPYSRRQASRCPRTSSIEWRQHLRRYWRR